MEVNARRQASGLDAIVHTETAADYKKTETPPTKIPLIFGKPGMIVALAFIAGLEGLFVFITAVGVLLQSLFLAWFAKIDLVLFGFLDVLLIFWGLISMWAAVELWNLKKKGGSHFIISQLFGIVLAVITVIADLAGHLSIPLNPLGLINGAVFSIILIYFIVADSTWNLLN